MDQNDKIKNIEKKEAEELAQIMAQRYGVAYLNLNRIAVDLDTLKLISEEQARMLGMAVIQSAGKQLQIVVKNPNLDSIKEKIEELRRLGYTPQIFLGSLPGLEHVWSRYKEIPAEVIITTNVVDITRSDFQEFHERVTNAQTLGVILSKKISLRGLGHTSEVLEMILLGALILEASDVHIEAEEERVRLRLRIDGLLQDIADFSHDLHHAIMNRIKLVSHLKLNVIDRSQDGRFTIRAKEAAIEVRVSTLPGPYGESVVMRILNPKAIALGFDDLGMQPPVFKLMLKELNRPNGMIITTGPTGSGKTTTLYAFLKKVREEPGMKIITIEDPIEYHLEGISQTQVNKEAGYTFENGLSAIVRQDPDVILVGEIRNKETAEIAMHASLTGHLVFSTLHTNSAAGTIPRLVDLGISANILAPAINVAIAQRLVRVLCKHCKKETSPTPEQKIVIEKVVTSLPAEYERPSLDHITTYTAGSCGECNHTGYRGRIGIYEVFLIDDEIERLILKNPPEAEVLALAEKQGMLTMQKDGILKILSGATSFEELERIVGLP
ncbi:MAG: ATPase, T2SS/T4P/T4SS family [Patescibacteria group bacterium]